LPPSPSRADRGHRIVGALLVAGGAMLFASKGILAKRLYEMGVGFEALTAIRALIALPLFWAFAAARESVSIVRGTRPRAALAAAIAGFLCYYVGALLDFQALTMIDASIERVLMFSYPAIVVLFTAVQKRQWPQGAVFAAMLLTYVGIFLSVGGLDGHAVRANALGAALVILAAITYAVYFMIGERYTREIGSTRFTLFAMSAAAVALVVHYLVRHGVQALGSIPAAGWLMLAVLGVFVMFVPALMQAEGVRRVGAQRGALVSTAGPPTTILLAWLLLGERMSAWQLTGVALIVGGILVLDLARTGKPAA
jgi:drug/metabolite transporter (DMT)-like permease